MTTDENPSSQPSGLQAQAVNKATEIGTALFMKAPQPAQNALLVGIGKAQPVVSKVQPQAKKLLAGGLGLLMLKKLRGRKG